VDQSLVKAGYDVQAQKFIFWTIEDR
jgi:hypothetical protein